MSGHIVSRRIYYGIFAALMMLTLLTVWIAFQDVDTHFWGLHVALNPVIALAIATTKALLVILYFMHVRYSSKLTKVTVLAGFFWLGILLIMTMGDYISRSWIKLP
ncbi:MAG TPA: cytochrome C oxidase subunit IV family protein [Terriglobales bacterium]|nr:cytochrome C oxidase subunit IV family protein [Terriglobales bacterium]